MKSHTVLIRGQLMKLFDALYKIMGRTSIGLLLMTGVCWVVPAQAQNWSTVVATNVVWTDSTKVTGKICFTATDSADHPINFRVGGGGQVVSKPACATVTNGAIVGTLLVPNPDNTTPAHIRYRIQVTDNAGDSLTYTNVAFSGGTFNFDNYVPTNTILPPVGASVANLSVGSLSILQNCVGCGSLVGFHSFYSFNIPKPDINDSGVFQAENDAFHYQIIGVSCNTDQGGVSINLEVRGNPNSAGTSVLPVSLSCSGTLNSAGSITPVTVPIGYSVAVIMVAVSGTPNILRINVSTTY